MITYKKLKKKPRAFKSIVGATSVEFDRLYRKFVPLWIDIPMHLHQESDC
jgi:hypothetical protein